MFRMTPHGHRFSNGGLTDSQLPLDVPGGSPDLGYLRRVPLGHNPRTRVKHLGSIPNLFVKSLCVHADRYLNTFVPEKFFL